VLRRTSPLLEKEQLANADSEGQRSLLKQARQGAGALAAILAASEPPTIGDVLEASAECGLLAIPDALQPFVRTRLDSTLLDGGPDEIIEDKEQGKQGPAAQETDEDNSELDAWSQALTAPFPELAKYTRYAQGLSQFDTHQGVKGLEFPRVMVVINDEEARGFMFNYGKLLGTHEKTKTDRDNEDAGKETSIDRTRRLLYVTCSRAEESLAIVYYAEDPPRARDALLRLGWFKPEEIELATSDN
jgi:DNA helicase-2/ATP-dependent DNA helicase PcrA